MALLSCVLVIVVFGAVNARITPSYKMGGLFPIAENSEKVKACKEMILKKHQDELKAERGPYDVKVALEDLKAFRQVVAGFLYHIDYKKKTIYTCKEGATCENKEPEVKKCTAVIYDDFRPKKDLRFLQAPVCA